VYSQFFTRGFYKSSDEDSFKNKLKNASPVTFENLTLRKNPFTLRPNLKNPPPISLGRAFLKNSA